MAPATRLGSCRVESVLQQIDQDLHDAIRIGLGTKRAEGWIDIDLGTITDAGKHQRLCAFDCRIQRHFLFETRSPEIAAREERVRNATEALGFFVDELR